MCSDMQLSHRSACCLATALDYYAAALQAITGAQIQKGFKFLVGAAPDLKLDVPDATAQIATFIARAVIDDVLPPVFVDELSAGVYMHALDQEFRVTAS